MNSLVKLIRKIAIIPLASIVPFTITVSCSSKDAPIDKITITLDPDGGTISTNSIQVCKETKFSSLTIPSPVKSGWTFKYWMYQKDGNWTQIMSDYVFKDNTTLKAFYVEDVQKVNVTLDLDGGTISGSTTLQVKKGKKYSSDLFPSPSKTGYTFKYWMYLNGSVWTEIDTSYTFNSDVTLKAFYTKDESSYIKDLNIQKINNLNHLYEVTYKEYDEAEGEEYLTKNFSSFDGSCSSFVQGKFVGRNFDWTYGDYAYFITHVSNATNRYASVGVALTSLKPNMVNNQSYLAQHRLAPFITVDGVNENGFYASINEVPAIDTSTNCGDGSSNPKLHELRLVRFLLDHAKSVADVESLISTYNIHGTTHLNEFHILIADKTGACGVIEFEKISSNSTYKKPKIYLKGSSGFQGVCTNFTFSGFSGDCSDWTKNSTITNHAEGCERYNIIDQALKNINISSLDEVLDVLKLVYYSKAWTIDLENDTDNFWFSEYNWSTRTKSTERNVANYYQDWQTYRNKYLNRTRNDSIWLTETSCAYDLATQQLKLIFEEETVVDKVFSIERN